MPHLLSLAGGSRGGITEESLSLKVRAISLFKRTDLFEWGLQTYER